MTIPASASRGPVAQLGSSVRTRGAYVVISALVGALGGLAAGWVWTRIAAPPAGLLTSGGVVFGETELNQQVAVTMKFLVTGLSAGLVVGLLLAWRGSRHGLAAVLAVVLACAVASFVSYWTGVHVFGPDAKAQLTSASVGDRITAPVSVGTKVAFLGWPIGGLIGALLAISWWPRTSAPSRVSPPTADVVTR